ncbi:hypothetical protein DIPPA_33431 [Diplonema papillatum]|nr:hypothetical protein DIPPA_33431 [Diplonema papillatum]
MPKNHYVCETCRRHCVENYRYHYTIQLPCPKCGGMSVFRQVQIASCPNPMCSDKVDRYASQGGAASPLRWSHRMRQAGGYWA